MKFFLAGSGNDRHSAHPELFLPPFLLFGIPLDRSFQAIFPGNLGLPTEDTFDLGDVTGMAKHLAGAISDKGDQ